MAARSSYSVAGSVESPRFNCLVINFLDHLDQLIHLSKQIAPHKSQAHRMKALFLTLGFSYR